MNNDDLVKRISDVVDEKIKRAIEPIIKQLENPNTGLGRINQKMDALWEQTVKLTEDMAEVQEAQDSHTATLKRIEVKNEKKSEDIEKIDKRLTGTEDHLGIIPPPELTIT